MASPVGGGNQFSSDVELTKWIQGLVQQELAKAARGGIGLHVDGATGDLIIDQGDIRSGNYVPGSAGWDLGPSGAAELGATSVRGGKLQSGNYVAGSAGWALDGAGSAELGATTVRGGKVQSGGYVAGSAGWALDGAGNAEFNALTLRGGIIGNDALANPVTVGSVGISQSNFSLPSTGGAYAVTSITVPTGFSQGIVMCDVNASVYNSAGAGDYVYCSANINGVTGGECATWMPNGYATGVAASGIRFLNGLGGGAFPVSVHLRTGSVNVPASASTIANLNAIAVFLR